MWKVQQNHLAYNILHLFGSWNHLLIFRCLVRRYLWESNFHINVSITSSSWITWLVVRERAADLNREMAEVLFSLHGYAGWYETLLVTYCLIFLVQRYGWYNKILFQTLSKHHKLHFDVIGQNHIISAGQILSWKNILPREMIRFQKYLYTI